VTRRRRSELTRLEAVLPAGRPRGADEALGAVAAAWVDAVGEPIARRAVPVRLRGDELLVHCESSVWAGELAMLARQLVAGLRATLGDRAPRRLRFEVGELPAPAPERRPPPALPEPTADERGRAAAVAARVADEELRARVERAVLTALCRERAAGG
jgi:predicted nucleic acid-binding Zn ribbon protein